MRMERRSEGEPVALPSARARRDGAGRASIAENRATAGSPSHWYADRAVVLAGHPLWTMVADRLIRT